MQSLQYSNFTILYFIKLSYIFQYKTKTKTLLCSCVYQNSTILNKLKSLKYFAYYTIV